MHILIVEDDRAIAENLYEFLESRGNRCDFAQTLRTARALLAEHRFDAIVLDRTLPDGDGITLARALRAGGSSTVVLMLTARDALAEKLDGFDAGVDDYVVKPFELQEIDARLVAMSRRGAHRADAQRLSAGNLSYDPVSLEVRVEENVLALPAKAVRLIALLLQNPNRVYSRRELEIAVWGQEQASSDNLRSLLHTLRRALGESADVELRNVRGLGYRLVAR